MNIHRGVYSLPSGDRGVDKARKTIAGFINCDPSELVFTKNASNALNMIALMYGDKYINEGDVIVTSELSITSSFLPWQANQRKGAVLRFVPQPRRSDNRGKFPESYGQKVKVVALNYVSNVMGYITR